MSKRRVARRKFLSGAALGVGAVAGAKLLPEASAQTHAQHAKTTAPAPAHTHANGEGHGAFFNDADSETVAAFAERLMPGAPGKPGARDAGVLNYIDLALAGAYADLQDFYRRGLAQLDTHCRKTYDQPFVRLTAAQQDEVIGLLESVELETSVTVSPTVGAEGNQVNDACGGWGCGGGGGLVRLNVTGPLKPTFPAASRCSLRTV